MSIHTLVGKSGYLFLINDTSNELHNHTHNDYVPSKYNIHKYDTIKHKFLMVIFPDKSYLYANKLPDKYIAKYRPALDIYKFHMKDNILDCYDFLKDEVDTYYKTDTHINNKGSILVYDKFIETINNKFNINIVHTKYTVTNEPCNSLSEYNLGIGDLTWDNNKGNLILDSTEDIYYKINETESVYCKYIITETSSIRLLSKEKNNLLTDVTNNHIGDIIVWDILSKYIIYKYNTNNSNNLVCVIFFDSFLAHVIQLYLGLFKNVYLIKDVFDIYIINKINPDYVFEFRIERFL